MQEAWWRRRLDAYCKYCSAFPVYGFISESKGDVTPRQMVPMNFITGKLSYMIYIAWQPGQQSHTSLGNFLSLQSSGWGFWHRVSEWHRTEFRTPLMWNQHSFFHSGPSVGNHGLQLCTTLWWFLFLFLLLFFFLYILAYNIITTYNKYNKEELGEREKKQNKAHVSFWEQKDEMRERDRERHSYCMRTRQQQSWRVVCSAWVSSCPLAAEAWKRQS